MLLPPICDAQKWSLARQIGINYAITKAAPELSGLPAPFNLDALRTVRNRFNEAGFQLYGLEGDQFDMNPIKLGLPNRDEYIEKYQSMLRNMGQLNIPLLCYNFMAVIGWFRTQIDIPERGGATVSGFDSRNTNEDVSVDLQISEQKLWKNLEYFLEAILPVAEENGIQMALHPDDPPLSPLKGVGRILTSFDAFDRILETYKSPANGITFCQATFKLMQGDFMEISEKWMKKQKIFFLHIRDVEGSSTKFRETFHDNGPTDMWKMFEHYKSFGFEGAFRPDHAPTMFGEDNNDFRGGLSVGYEVMGKVFAIGYLKGICESLGIEVK